MEKETTWVVVANNALARIFRVVRFPELEELAGLMHPESRLHDRDLVSSRPGSTTEMGGSRRSSYEPPTDPKKLEFEKFAREIGAYLTSAHQKGEFSRLYIIASPSSLGLLRKQLSGKTHAAILKEAPKDMVDHRKDEIEKELAVLRGA